VKNRKSHSARNNAKALSMSWSTPTLYKATKTKYAYHWIVKAVKQLSPKKVKNPRIKAGTGAGKSVAILYITEAKLNSNQFKKAIIAVPQANIATGFLGTDVRLSATRKCDLVPMYNFTTGDPNGVVKSVIKWLRTGYFDINNNTGIVTHATLALVRKELIKTGELYLLDKVLIWIDEAHHLSVTEKTLVGTKGNCLGSLVTAKLKRTKSGIGLVTATNFRAKGLMLTTEQEKLFTTYTLKQSDWLAEMKYLQSFVVNTHLAGPKGYLDPIEAILKKAGKKQYRWIVHIPSVNSRGARAIKKLDFLKAVTALFVKYGYKRNTIVDLVNDKGRFTSGPLKGKKIRTYCKKLISNKAFKESTSQYKVVIALGMYKEGSDWPLAERSIIVGHRGSPVEIIQMYGRPTRDVKGKKHAIIDQILPFGLKGRNAEAQRANVNEWMQHIMFTYLFNVACTPVKLYKAVKGGKKRYIPNWFEEYFPDMDEKIKVCNLGTKLLGKIDNDNPDATLNEILKKFVSESVSMLKDLGVTAHYGEVAKYIWTYLIHTVQPKKNAKVEYNIDSDLVGEGIVDPISGLLSYTTQFGFDNFSKLMGIVFLPFTQAKELALSLKLKSQTEWAEYCKSGKKPADIPSNPNLVYKDNGWVGYGDWLGTGRVGTARFKGVFRPFAQAREFVRSLKLKSKTEWYEYCKSGKKPADIPSRPDTVYKDNGWVSWGDWLGNEFLSYTQAREFVRSLKLKSHIDWKKYCKSGKKPADIPSNPERTYKDNGWVGIGDWLGNGKVSRSKK
jgi:superfamily II DNA or RNA helicase